MQAWRHIGDGAAVVSGTSELSLAKRAQQQQETFSKSYERVQAILSDLIVLSDTQLKDTDLGAQFSSLHKAFADGLTGMNTATQELNGIVKELTELVSGLIRKNAELSSEVGKLAMQLREYSHVLADLQLQKKQLMVGHLPANMDSTLTRYVFGSQFRPSHMSLVVVSSMTNVMNSEQRLRFQKFLKFLEVKGFDSASAVGISSIVRKERLDAAHGSVEEHEATTVAELTAYAADLAIEEEDFKRLLKLTQLFSVNGKPLKGKRFDTIVQEIEAANTSA